MQDRIAEALKRSKADFTEIRIETRDTSSLAFRGKSLEAVNSGRDVGGMVRVLHNGNWGVSTFNNLNELPRHVALALECAQSLGTGEAQLAEVAPSRAEVEVQLAHDFRQVGLAEKKELMEHYNQLALRQPGVKDTMVSYSDTMQTLYYGNSDGTYVKQERPYAVGRVHAYAREGDNVQQAFGRFSVGWDFNLLYNRDEEVKKIAARAVDLLKARPVQAGNYTVVLDPGLAGVFVHEAFGHLSEADHIDKNPRAQEMMKPGRRFGPDFLNITDGGVHPNLYGSLQYDDEGTPAQETQLVKDGLLVGRLHNRETAAKLGEVPTGNARALDYRWAPMVRMTNTCIKPSTISFEEMIKDIKLGIYAVDSIGGQTAMENFSFSSQYAYMIRDGQLAEMVKDVILAGNVFHTLANIEAVGNDLDWWPGGCGKGPQSPLPVGAGSPHIRIKNVLIGGQAGSKTPSAFQV